MLATRHIEGLRRAADRLRWDSDYLASAYQDWAGDNYDLNNLAQRLVATVDSVVDAALCRRPYSSGINFSDNVAKIARHAGLDFDVLLAFLREAEALRAFRVAPAKGGLLAAARDRANQEPPGADR
ncbi:MAG: hypothetical protein JOZ27_02870 [Caulobacteraceae bacterium]|nr:hypothetical protein [Caulobacteraceae bacterium]